MASCPPDIAPHISYSCRLPFLPCRCPESGSGYLMGGPIWARPMHDQEWVEGLLQQMNDESERYAAFARLKGILTAVVGGAAGRAAVLQ